MAALTPTSLSQGFMPHGHCYLWNPTIVWTMATSDTLIGASYVAISISLYLLVRKIRMPFYGMFWVFGIFIAACGIGHWTDVLTLWIPSYWLTVAMRVVTAVASLSTAIILLRVSNSVVALDEEMKNNRVKIQEQQQLVIHSSKMANLGEMAGSIAHEINTPLGVISMNCGHLQEIFSKKEFDQDTAEKCLNQIEKTTFRIAKIVKSLRLLSRDGKDDPMLMTSVQSILDDVLSMCRMRFKSRGVELDCPEVDPELSIQCQKVQISQVVLNLLNNACDAVENVSEKKVRIEVLGHGHLVEISVIDTGSGIDPSIKHKIMQPFFTTKPSGHGTGLGLSISKNFVQHHHGDLTFFSTTKGTRFVITLPRMQQDLFSETNAA